MSQEKFDAQEWGRRLEAGDRDDPTLMLAAQLQERRLPAQPLPATAREAIRGRLGRRRAALALAGWARSAVGLLVLAAAVLFIWSSLAQWEQPIQPGAAPAAEPAALPTATPTAMAMVETTDSEGVMTVILEPTIVYDAPDPPPTPFPPTLEPPLEQPDLADGGALVIVDPWQSAAAPHPQVAARFSLTLAEAQEQVAYPIQAPTLLPAGFHFVGADVSAVYPDQPLEPGVGIIFAQGVIDRARLLDFHQHPVPGVIPNFDPHEYEEPGVTIQSTSAGDFSGEYRLDGRSGRSTLRWQANGFRYTLTMNGDLTPVDQLIEIASSLQAR